MAWTELVINANGRAQPVQIVAMPMALRQGVPRTIRSIASATSGKIAAAGLQSIAPATNNADAPISARDLPTALIGTRRDRTSAFSARRAKNAQLTPRSSEIQATLSTCRGCSAKTREVIRAVFRRRVS